VRIFTKLFLLLSALVVLPLLAVLLVLVHNTGALKQDLTVQVDLAGDLVSDKSGYALRAQVERTHIKIVQEKAGRLEAFFESIRSAIQLQCTLIGQYLGGDVPARASYPIYTADEIADLRDNNPDWKADVFQKQPYVMYQLVAGLDPDFVAQTISQLRQLGGVFHHAFLVTSGCASTYLGHRDGVMVGYPGGSRVDATYDPRLRPWYQLAERQQSIVWTPVYLDRGENGLIVTCAGPVYSPADGSLLAVAAMDVRLKDLIDELFALGDVTVSEATLIDDEGRVRVSATFENGKANFDPKTIMTPPTVRDFRDGDLNAAYDQIIIGGTPDGMIEALSEAGEEILYIYSTVRFRSGTGMGGRDWRYVLKVPLGPVVQPASEIRSDVSRVTRKMRSTMEVGIAELALVVGAITLLAMGIALLLAYRFAGSATKPLVEMQQVAGQIAKGNFDQEVAVRSRDEIGHLGIAINEMIFGLKEREFVKKTFKRYVAASVVDELILNPTKANLGGERKELTIFFSDLKGFTTLSETMPPDMLVALLNEYLGAMTEAIFAQEGTLDKYVGDAILAFWGAPISRQDDALRACRTALLNLKTLKGLWPDWERRGLPKLQVRIGIQTGPVVVGNIGSDVQMNYTVIGDTANTASRLEGANKAYGTCILIGECTRIAAGDTIVAREIDRITVMGKSRGIRIYELLGLKGELRAEILEAAQTFETALARYRCMAWDDAVAGFEQVIRLLGGDQASTVFLHRIETLRENPPAANWDGGFTMTEK